MLYGVMLAAGASARMGRPKQLLDWGGVPLIRHVAMQALGSRLSTIVVVTGAEAEAVSAALDGLPLQVVHNPHFSEGQSTSLRAGIASLPADAAAAVVLLGDQPFVTPALIDSLIDAAQSSSALIVAPRIGGRRSNPVLFKAALFPRLLEVQGDQGARQIVQQHLDHLLLVPCDLPDADIDTPEDYMRLKPARQSR